MSKRNITNRKDNINMKQLPIVAYNVFVEILKELEERKQWAENGMMVYTNDTEMKIEYRARIEEIENAICLVSNLINNYTKLND